MCTIIVRHHIDDWCSTLVAANRDEFYDRSASGPIVLRSIPRIVGGRDEREGGTWFGVTREGLFAGLTNQRSLGRRDDSLASRGRLVVDALATGSFDGVATHLRQIDPLSYNEFNLIFGDGQSLCAAYGRRDAGKVEIESLGAGIHVLCNDRLGSAAFPKAARARARVESIPSGPWTTVQAGLIEILSDRSLPEASEVPPLPPDSPFDGEVARRLQAICVATPIYGTVSSTIAGVRPGRVEQYWFSAGPPSSTSFVDVAHLIRGDE